MASARTFSKILSNAPNFGIAMTVKDINMESNSIHRPRVLGLFPQPSANNMSRHPMSVNGYMRAIMRVTTSEVEDLLHQMRDSGIYIPDKFVPNLPPVQIIIRVPASTHLLNYESIYHGISWDASRFDNILGRAQTTCFVGGAAVLFDEKHHFVDKTVAQWAHTFKISNTLSEDEDCLLRLEILEKALELNKNKYHFRKINFVGPNKMLFQCGWSSLWIPNQLYDSFVRIHKLLKSSDTYTFSFEHGESCHDAHIFADRERMITMGENPDISKTDNLVQGKYDHPSASFTFLKDI